MTPGEGGVAPFDPPVFCPSGIVHHQLDPQASSGVTHLPRHGLKAESAFSMKPREKTRPICSQTESGKSVYFLWQRAARVQAQRSTNKGGFSALAGFQRAAALGAPLVTFPATGKSPGVEGRSALPMGAVWGGRMPPTCGAETARQQKNPFFCSYLFFLVKTFLCNKERVG